MANKRTRYNDDYELINGKWVLKDGHRARFSFMDGDDLQRAVGQHFAGRTTANDGQRIVDGYGDGGLALHHSGYRIFASGQNDQSFYDAAEEELVNAWRSPPETHTSSVTGAGERSFAGKRVGDRCTVRSRNDLGTEGDRGTVQRDESGMLVCVSDTYRSEDALDTRDHATKMQALYDARDREMSEAWRNPPTR